MPDDLAGRIGDGAVAVLELVPGEQRFADLSSYVLRGGASRFAPVVADDESIRYVLPVGIPGAKLDYGTLLIQRSRCALVWRTEASRPYHALIIPLGPNTTVALSAATIRGEAWGRFDLTHPGNADMTFLVPPVASTALPRMLHRVLLEEPGGQRVSFDAPPLPAAVVEGDEPDVTASETVAAPPVVEVAAAPPVVEVETPPDAEDATTLLPATQPTQPSPPADQPTQVLPATPAPADAPAQATADAPAPTTWVPRGAEPAASGRGSKRPAEGTADPVFRDEALYREATRRTPVPGGRSPVGGTPAPVVRPAPVAQPAPATGATAVPAALDEESGADRPMSDSVKGFLTGLSATLVVGALVVLAKVLGLLG